MNGEIAQIVALTCHGNAFLAGHDIGTFFPDNSTFCFCARVNFAVLKKSFFGGIKSRELAKTPALWFAALKSAGALGIRLYHTSENEPGMSDRMSAGLVGGGGTWAMEVLYPADRSEHWVARWEADNRDAPDQRIWRVSYGRTKTGNTIRMAQPPLDSVKLRLDRSLRDIHSFSGAHNCGSFTQVFSDALAILETKGEYPRGHHSDLAPAGILSAEASRLLDACQKAWVFGGMGSWNDVDAVGVGQAYDRVSEQLYRNINQTIAAAASASCTV